MLVVDCSVAVKWFLEEPGDREALALLRTGERLIAPELIVAELVNVLWKRVTTGAIEHSQAADVPQAIPKTLAELCPHSAARRAGAGDRRRAAPSGLRLLLSRAGRGPRPQADHRRPAAGREAREEPVAGALPAAVELTPPHRALGGTPANRAGLLAQPDAAVLRDRPARVPGDLPGVPVGIGEIARIAAPERVLRGLQDLGARGFASASTASTSARERAL